MNTTNDITRFQIDKRILLNARRALLSKKRTPDEEKELLIISMFLHNTTIASSSQMTKDEFRQNYKADSKILCDQYFEYLEAIFEFAEAHAQDDVELSQYSPIVTNYEEVFESVHDFFYRLDRNWFKLFNKIYRNRHSTVSLSQDRSFSVSFPNTNLWIANIEAKGTIEDYANVAHEYAHGIEDQINHRVRTYAPENIFIELFPTVCQLLFLEQNLDIKQQSEITKYLENFHKTMSRLGAEAKFKYNLVNAFPSVSNPRNLSRLVKKNWGLVLSKQEFSTLFSSSVIENISYVYPYLIAMELIDLYKTDPDLFKYKVNTILRSEEAPLETIKKLEIVPNSILK